MTDNKEDNLKEFNPNSKFGNLSVPSFNFSSMNWTRREYILGGVLTATLLIMFILAGFLGAAHNKTVPKTCNNARCLEMAAYVAYTMNSSVDPCTDFYQYACGTYSSFKYLEPDHTSRTVMDDVYHRNEDKLRNLLEAPTKRSTEWAAELKLKDLFNSCLDDYLKERRRGRPFIEKILPKMGGWYVLNSWDSNQFDLNSNLKTVQTDLWVAAFWTNSVGFDWKDWDKNVVQLYPAGSGKYMSWSYYTRTDNQKVKDDYKKFMRRLANLIARDSKLNIPDIDSRIEDFVSDAFTMETKLAELYKRSAVNRDRFETSSRITLNDLKINSGNVQFFSLLVIRVDEIGMEEVPHRLDWSHESKGTTYTAVLEHCPNGVIDWVAQMQYEFPNALTKDSSVILYKKDFIFGLGSLVNNLDSGTKNRMLHNYFIWRLLESYATHLSWEYVHANREYYVDIRGQTEFLGTWKYCYQYIDKKMPEALSSLFVRDHFADKNRDKAKEITDYVTKALISEIDDNKFLDSATKKIAKSKLAKTVYKIGYPDFMLSADKLDKIYSSLAINRTDYFQNIMNVNQFEKVHYDNELAGDVDRTKWVYNVYDTSMAVLFYWNEIIVPAGFLQSPLYDYKNPHYANFGSMGSLIGHFMTNMIDERGRYWSEKGKWTPQTWWTNGTKTNYASVKQCVLNYYTNKTQGPYIAPDGTSEMIPIKAKWYARRAISYTTGIKLALKAYRKWESDNGVEPLSPVLGLTNDQMFFVAQAQSYCYNRKNAAAYSNAVRGRVEEDVRTNLAMSQISEFTRAFKCKPGSQMNAPSKCAYY
ncbi:hypothetical protein LOTGIDRAFT_160662 [Lottia gigantea]|uniref:Endothelin-converting enzyme 1 n=1 Tax=Lottia gigantea TaxID=225164 RepID=V3ZVG8_LOTGI|nr:hypothetical protein LOTGIDRAFT_160662 [Lottia gigantea]ESO95503.1 hypothetical protein LOTGIDRAFT_160662 [Lottia gigantea]